MNTYSCTTRLPALILAIIAAVILLYVGQLAARALESVTPISTVQQSDTYNEEN